MLRRPLLALATTAVTASSVAALAVPSASAAVTECGSKYGLEAPQGLSAFTNILNTRNISCGEARNVVRRYDQSAKTFTGKTFRLGPYRCSVYSTEYEYLKARCVNGSRAFRVGFGA